MKFNLSHVIPLLYWLFRNKLKRLSTRRFISYPLYNPRELYKSFKEDQLIFRAKRNKKVEQKTLFSFGLILKSLVSIIQQKTTTTKPHRLYPINSL